MRITVLVENTSRAGLPVEHGLSLHIAMENGRQLLFDMGQSDLFVHNATVLNVDLSQVDVAVLSHGHYDHGGGLPHFLSVNSSAPVYVHRNAFQPHYSLRDTRMTFIGLRPTLSNHTRLVLCNDVEHLSPDSLIFSLTNSGSHRPPGNHLLYGPDKTHLDTFDHEQNLLLTEGTHRVLFAGCAHNGISNIVRQATLLAGCAPTHVIGGMHLLKCGLSTADEKTYIHHLADTLLNMSDTLYFTMHCTGVKPYERLHAHMSDRIAYLSCGDVLEI